MSLGTLGGSTSRAEALNDQGDVVGSSTLANGNTHAFLYRGGSMRDLGTFGGATSHAYDVNENGVVVGDASLSPTSCGEASVRAFVFDGQLRQLNAHPVQPPMTSQECHISQAFAINDRGDIVGHYTDSRQSDDRAWALTSDGKSYIWGGRASANDVNNSGIAVATQGIGDTTGYVGSLPPVSGAEWSALTFDGRARWGTAEAINEKGWVVGGSDRLGEQARAYLYRNSAMTDLGTLDGVGSRAYGLNEAGDVVGTSSSRAFLWAEGRLVDLNTLIPPGSGWSLETAYDINNRGQIAGVGTLNGQKRAFLLNPPDLATLTATPATVESGAAVTVTWTAPAATTYDWIGLYRAGAADTAMTKWFYTATCGGSVGTAKASGSCSLTMPGAAGTYELRLFKNGGYTRLATFGPLTVAAAAPPPPAVTLSATPATVTPNSVITVSWQGLTTATGLDSIILVKSGAPNDEALQYFYLSSCAHLIQGIPAATGSCPATVPPETGTYELRLLRESTLLATSNPVTVAVSAPTPSAATISATPATIAAGGTLTATWQGVPSPASKDWIGLYKSGAADTAFTTWVYTSTCALSAETAKASGSCTLIGPATGGTYELRLFKDNGYTRLATSGPITVAAPTLSATPASVSAGGSVTVTWQGVTSPTSYDWIGVYKSGAADGAFTSWLYNSSCTFSVGTAKASGTCSVKLPSAPGTYELRLFRNGGFTRVATSGPVTVTAAAASG